MTQSPALDEDALQQIYTWIDDIPLSRPKKNITRDFSDGVLIAEIIHHFIPKMVDLHNYTAACSSTTKLDNWNLLSRKCFSKLSYNIDENLVKGAVSCKPGVIELILQDLRQYIESYVARKKAAGMVERHKYHDELSPESYAYEMAENYHPQAAYNGAMNGYVYMYNEGNPAAPPLAPNDHLPPQYQYQYQSQPLPIMGEKPGEMEGHKNNSESTMKTRKPVTQAVKMKVKQSTNQKALANGSPDLSALRIALEEKEQALLSSQETVQILQAKIRRLEHLLHLKDLRINEMKQQQPSTVPPGNVAMPPQQPHHNQQRHFSPNQNFPMHPPPPHGFSNTQYPPHPPLPHIPRPPPDDPRKYQR